MVPTGIEKPQFMAQVARLEEHFKELQVYAGEEQDKLTHAALERLVQITVEDALNLGNHLVSGLGLTKAESYREVFQRLEEAKIISGKLSQELQQFAVFRNRLVHLYWKIEEVEFQQQMKKIGVLLTFVKAVIKYLKKKKLL